MRSFIILSCLLFPGLACAADAAPELQSSAQCELREPTFDSREVECSLKASADTRRYTLQVNFSGGHDDTMAKLAPSLNGTPLSCEDGSKVSLMGEDGDVSLVCLFTAPRGSKRAVLLATFTWSHAEYVSYTLTER